MIENTATASGRVRIYKNDELILDTPNMVVNSGRNYLASCLVNNNTARVTHIAVGSGQTASALTDTALVTEIARNAATGSNTNNVASFNSQFVAGVGTGPWYEAGMFTASSGGVMYTRTTFPVQNKGPNDVFTVYWDVTVS